MPSPTSLIEKLRAAKRREAESTEVGDAPKVEAKPAEPAKPEPRAAAPKPLATATRQPPPKPPQTASLKPSEVPTVTDASESDKQEDKVWLEPVPLASLDRRAETTELAPPPPTPITPAGLEDHDGEQTVAFVNKPVGRISNPMPPPATKPRDRTAAAVHRGRPR